MVCDIGEIFFVGLRFMEAWRYLGSQRNYTDDNIVYFSRLLVCDFFVHLFVDLPGELSSDKTFDVTFTCMISDLCD